MRNWAALCLLALLGCGGDEVIPGAIEYVSAPVSQPTPNGRVLRIATVAHTPDREVEETFRRIERIVAEVKRADPSVRLVHFGEAALGWYFEPAHPKAYPRRIAQEIPGATLERLAALAKQYAIYLATGLFERDGADVYNSLVVIDPQGTVLGVHRKMLLFSLDEQSGITQADERAEVVDVDGFRVGLTVCFDGKSEWLQRALVERSPDLILWSVASDLSYSEVSPTARKLGAWISVANRFGSEDREEYDGEIFVADPSGTVRAESRGRSNFIITDIPRGAR